MQGSGFRVQQAQRARQLEARRRRNRIYLSCFPNADGTRSTAGPKERRQEGHDVWRVGGENLNGDVAF